MIDNQIRAAAFREVAAGILVCFCTLLFGAPAVAADLFPTNDYAAVDALFTKHCLECHEAKDPEANLVLDTFQTLMKGSENGAVILPGKSAESLLVKMIEGRIEKEGKK